MKNLSELQKTKFSQSVQNPTRPCTIRPRRILSDCADQVYRAKSLVIMHNQTVQNTSRPGRMYTHSCVYQRVLQSSRAIECSETKRR